MIFLQYFSEHSKSFIILSFIPFAASFECLRVSICTRFATIQLVW